MSESSQLLHSYLFSTTPPIYPVLAEAASLHSTQLKIELAGVAWIGAELLIFYLVLRVNFMVRTHSPDQTVRAQHTRRPLVGPLLVAFLIPTLLVLGRYVLIKPLPDAIHALILRNPSDLHLEVRALYMAQAHTHLALWCGFITLWVVLEIAIVYAGFKTYRCLRCIFESLPKGSES